MAHGWRVDLVATRDRPEEYDWKLEDLRRQPQLLFLWLLDYDLSVAFTMRLNGPTNSGAFRLGGRPGGPNLVNLDPRYMQRTVFHLGHSCARSGHHDSN